MMTTMVLTTAINLVSNLDEFDTLVTNELGVIANFTVRLSAMPTAVVSLVASISSGSEHAQVVGAASDMVRLLPSQWETGVPVLVAGLADSVNDRSNGTWTVRVLAKVRKEVMG